MDDGGPIGSVSFGSFRFSLIALLFMLTLAMGICWLNFGYPTQFVLA
jgi:hypothetical protein